MIKRWVSFPYWKKKDEVSRSVVTARLIAEDEKNDDDRPTDCLLADCRFGLNCRADCLFRLITDHGLWVCDGGELPRWDGMGLPLDARRSTEEGSEPLRFLPGAFSMIRKRPNELPRTARGRSRRRVDTTINYDAFTFGWGVKN